MSENPRKHRMYPNHNEWLDRVSSSPATVNKIGDLRISAADHPQDDSLPVFQELQNMGYDTVEWHAENSTHAECKLLQGHTWTIPDFLHGLSHNAPIFERTHPGDRTCFVMVTGPDLEPIQVGPWPFK